jgi:ribose 5-phosphate isomerase B
MALIVAVASDHGGFQLKTAVVSYLRDAGHEVLDLGPEAAERCDYPDYAHAVATCIAAGDARFGVLCCGSGIGMSMAANRHPGIRAALVHDVTSARLSRQHNDAQVICLGERLTGETVALEAVHAFLQGEFQGGRHVGRVAKIDDGAP